MTKTILIVEDNELNMKLFNDLLQAHGYDTLQTKDGHEAVAMTEEHHPDLILMDISMPGIDGFEACRCLKLNEVTNSIPIIFISAQMEMAEIEKVFSHGGVDYLNKPFRQEEVLARVNAHLEIVKLRQEKEELLQEVKMLKEKT